MSKRCVECGVTFQLPVTEAQVKAWTGGELIQRAMPQLTDDQRELFLTGMCGGCFDLMFAEDS